MYLEDFASKLTPKWMNIYHILTGQMLTKHTFESYLRKNRSIARLLSYL